MKPITFRSRQFLLATTLLLTPALATAQSTGTAPKPEPKPAEAQAPAAAPTMAEIEKAYQRKDFVFVRNGLMKLAETDNSALVQYRLGRVLAEGRGGPRDMQAAADWLKKAVEQNNNDAAVLLARIYLSSKSKEGAKAAGALLNRAAARGHAEGQYYLGLLHRNGTGVEKSATESFNWFLASAEQDYTEAQFELARAYSRGAGTKQSNTEAERWLTRAAGAGHVQAQYFLASALALGQGVTKNPKEAVNWYLRAAEAGHPLAQRELGMHYLKGLGTPANPTEGLRWLTTAANAGEPGAQVNLGVALSEGADWNVPRNDAEAVKWFRTAMAQSSPQGTAAFARMQEQGRGVEQNLGEAVKTYRKAVQMGFVPAALRLGELAAEGQLDTLVAPQNAVPWVLLSAEKGNVKAVSWLETQAKGENRQARTGLGLYLLKQEKELDRAATLLTEAAGLGDVVAQFKLGEMLTTGTGVELDYVQAHKWFNVAAAQGMKAASEKRDTVAKLMTPEQIAEAQTAAREWFANEANRAPKTKQVERTVIPKVRAND